MPRSKLLDQLLLLLSALVFIAVFMSLHSYLHHNGISYRLSFFIEIACLSFFIMTWQTLRWFRHTSKFWKAYAFWATLHIAAYLAWGLSGRRVELCAVTILIEDYALLYLAKSPRFQHIISAPSPTMSQSEPPPPISSDSI